MASTPVALGASAAVNAIVMLQVMLFPQEMIYIYMVLPVPAAAFGLLYIVGDMFGMLGVSKPSLHLRPFCMCQTVILCRSCRHLLSRAYILMHEQCLHSTHCWSDVVHTKTEGRDNCIMHMTNLCIASQHLPSVDHDCTLDQHHSVFTRRCTPAARHL